MTAERLEGNLFELERVERVADLVGNQLVKRQVSYFLRKGHYRPGFIVCGPWGAGKSTTSRYIARALVCPNVSGIDPCGKCDVCSSYRPNTATSWGRGINVRNCAEYGVDRLQKDLYDARWYAWESPIVFVLEEFQEADNRLQKQLLTTLEDPSLNAVLLLVTTHPQEIVRPLAQRLYALELKPPPTEELVSRLTTISAKYSLGLDELELRDICIDSGNLYRECLNRMQLLAASKLP